MSRPLTVHRAILFLAVSAIVGGTTGCRSIFHKALHTGDVSEQISGPVMEDVALEPRRRLDSSAVSDPAKFCPPDTQLYLHVDRLAAWHADAQVAPFVSHVRGLLASLCPPKAWAHAEKHLGLNGTGLFERYFGHTAALIVLGESTRSGLVLVSRAHPDDIRRLPAAFGLRPVADLPDLGHIRFHALQEGNIEFRIALGKRWFVLTEARNSAALLEVVEGMLSTGPEGHLAAFRPFRHLSDMLPRNRRSLLFVQNHAIPCHHASALTIDESGLLVLYAGTDPVRDEEKHLDRMPAQVARHLDARWKITGQTPLHPEYPHLSQWPELEFGFLPASVVGVGALNVIHHCPQNLGLLDVPILFGSLRRDILPAISPPVLGFIGTVGVADKVELSTVNAPVAGVAVRLGTQAVAADLDQLVQTLHLLATLGSLELGKALFGITAARELCTDFKVADFGNALVRWIKDPAIAALAALPEPAGLRRIAFGQIDDWYVVCTQEEFFRQFVQARSNPELRLKDSENYREFAISARPEQLLTVLVDAPALTTLLGTIHQHLQQNARHPQTKPEQSEEADRKTAFHGLGKALEQLVDAHGTLARHWRQVHMIPANAPRARANKHYTAKGRRGKDTPPTDPEHAIKPLQLIGDALNQRHSFALHVWRGPDGTPRAELRILTLPNH